MACKTGQLWCRDAQAHLSFSVVAVSITRLIYLVHLDETSPDVNWNFAGTQIWTCVEMNIAIVSGEKRIPTDSNQKFETLGVGTSTDRGAVRWRQLIQMSCAGCLPSLRPILSLIITGTPSPSYRRSAARKSLGGSKFGHSPWGSSKSTTTTSAHGGATGKSRDSDDDHLIGQPLRATGPESRRIGCTANVVSTDEAPIALHQLGANKGISVKNEIDIQWHKVSDV